MKILILEDNLIWSSRLAKTVTSLGHEAVVLDRIPTPMPPADVAILNLRNSQLCSTEIINNLKNQDTKTVAHAGHKEKPLLEQGNEMGVDMVVSNSTLTYKLAETLAQLSL